MVSSTHEHREYLRRGKFPPPVQRAAVADDWRGRGFGLEEFKEGPGGELRSMGQSKDELLVVADGVVECEVRAHQHGEPQYRTHLPSSFVRVKQTRGGGNTTPPHALQVDGRVCKVDPGDELYIPLATQYAARNVGTTYAHIFVGYA